MNDRGYLTPRGIAAVQSPIPSDAGSTVEMSVPAATCPLPTAADELVVIRKSELVELLKLRDEYARTHLRLKAMENIQHLICDKDRELNELKSELLATRLKLTAMDNIQRLISDKDQELARAKRTIKELKATSHQTDECLQNMIRDFLMNSAGGNDLNTQDPGHAVQSQLEQLPMAGFPLGGGPNTGFQYAGSQGFQYAGPTGLQFNMLPCPGDLETDHGLNDVSADETIALSQTPVVECKRSVLPKSAICDYLRSSAVNKSPIVHTVKLNSEKRRETDKKDKSDIDRSGQRESVETDHGKNEPGSKDGKDKAVSSSVAELQPETLSKIILQNKRLKKTLQFILSRQFASTSAYLVSDLLDIAC